MIWRVILTRSRVLRDPFIISHPFLFVKGFLKSFSKFFTVLFEPSLDLSGSARLLYHNSFRLSRGFEKFFKNFFVTFVGSLEVVPFAKRPAYYITSLFVCQEVFQKFFQLFRDFLSGLFAVLRGPVSRLPRAPLLDSRCLWQLAYYSTSPLNCQGVFTKFFHFGIFGTLS